MVRRRRIAGAALIAALAAGLAGCSFLGDIADGQRITTERLGAADALRVLVGQLEQLDQVESASYSFDAVDVSTMPAVEVELATLDGDDWREVAELVEQAGAADALADFPIAARLSSDTVTSGFDTQYGAQWLGDEPLSVAERLLGFFPGATVDISGVSESSAYVSVGTSDPAEQLLDRMWSDPGLRTVLDGLDPNRVVVNLGAPGVSLSGALTPDAASWAREVLAVDLPRPDYSDPDAPYPTEWVSVSVGGAPGDTMLGVELVGTMDVGAGTAWDELVRLLASAVPELNGPGACVPLQISYSWPGVRGNWPSFVTECAGWGSNGGDPDRPSLVELREALAASGIDLAALGYTLG